MKRDPRLHGLSADHHHALVLARRVAREAGVAELELAALVASVRRAFDLELAPHFAIEEQELLPALRDAGEGALVDRTLAEHAALRGHLADAERGDASALVAFGQLLAEHVRFEEHHLFPACEARLPDDVLARVAARSRR